MKRILAILAVLTTLGITLPSEAKADHGYGRRVVSYSSCGRPVYATYRIIGYDRCGNPVGQWVTERSNCGCNMCNPRRSSYHGYSHHSNHHSNHCNPGMGFGGSGGSFFFRFGR
jgi:hypothetical protein